MKMKKRAIALVAALVFVISGLSGCGSKRTDTDISNSTTKLAAGTSANTSEVEETSQEAERLQLDPNKQVTLSFSHSSTGDLIRQVKQDACEAYTEKNPNVKVEIIVKPSNEYSTWLSAQFAAGLAPDVFTHNNPQDASLFDPANKYTIDFAPYLEKITPYSGEAKLKDIFYPTILDQSKNIKFNNFNPGVPQQFYIAKIVYNKKIFEDSGITALPNTWEDMIAISKILKDKGFIPYGTYFADYALHAEQIMAAIIEGALGSKLSQVDKDNDGNVNDEEMKAAVNGGIIDLNDPGIKDAYKFYFDYMLEYGIPNSNGVNWSDMYTLFYQGKVAMLAAQSSSYSTIFSNGIDFGTFDFPVLNKSLVAGEVEEFIGTAKAANWLAISQISADKGNADYAADFIMFMESFGALKKWADAFGPPQIMVSPMVQKEMDDYGKTKGWPVVDTSINGRQINPIQCLSPFMHSFGAADYADQTLNLVQTYVAGKSTFDEFYNGLVNLYKNVAK